MSKWSKIWGVVFALWTSAAAADVYVTVGVGSGCHYATIQAAINASNPANGVTHISVTRSQTYTAQAIDIDSKNVHLFGGYESCTDIFSDSVHTVLSGAGGSNRSIINIRGATSWVELNGLTLRDGHEQLDNTSYGGAIDITEGPHPHIHLENVTITQNQAGIGGGISIRNGTPSNHAAVNVTLGTNTSINNNLGWWGGGGVFCGDSTLTTVSMPVSVISNRAGDLSDDDPSAYGGGLFLVNCTAEIAGGPFAVALNESTRAGGGIMASGRDTRLDLYNLSDSVPTQVYANTSHTYGGGLSIEEGADVYAWDVNIDQNRAYGGGGAVALYSGDIYYGTDQTTFTAEGQAMPGRPQSKRCFAVLDCNRVTGNTARSVSGSVRPGAAFRISSTAQGLVSGESGWSKVMLHGTRVGENDGDDLARLAADQSVSGANGLADFATDGALIDRNTLVGTLVSAADEGEDVALHNTTIAGNSFSSASGSILLMYRKPTIHGSLIWQPGRDLVQSLSGTIPTGFVSGNVLHDVGDIAVSDPVVNVVADPLFMDAAGGDYRLSFQSPAIDFAAPTGVYTRDGQPRVIDLDRANRLGPQDAGAYEMTASALENLLSDGFE